jgi:hypothetical protein
MTIRTAQGTCRAFHARAGMSGLACYSGGEGTLLVVAGGPGVAWAGEYRMAAGEVAPAVMAKADRRMQGDPLTPAEEQALLRQALYVGDAQPVMIAPHAGVSLT